MYTLIMLLKCLLSINNYHILYRYVVVDLYKFFNIAEIDILFIYYDYITCISRLYIYMY